MLIVEKVTRKADYVNLDNIQSASTPSTEYKIKSKCYGWPHLGHFLFNVTCTLFQMQIFHAQRLILSLGVQTF